MKRLCATALGVLAVGGVAVCGAGSAGAVALSPSGDSCSVTGSGTSYAVSIMVPTTAPQQFGFAFGAGGVSVAKVDIPDSDGAFQVETGPAKTTGAWNTISAVSPGTVVANVTTGAPVTGSFTVVPVGSPQSSFFDPITCPISAQTAKPIPTPTGAFNVSRRAVYDAKARAWRLAVTISSAGIVRALEPEPTIGTASAKSATAKSLVQAHSAGLKSRGTVTLLIKPTPIGAKALATAGAINVKLNVTFVPTLGKQTRKLVTLALKKS